MRINLKSEIVKTADGYIDDPVLNIAEKHDAPMELIELMLEWGIGVEMEHVDDYNKAKELAMQHLKEDPVYYKKVLEIGADGHNG